MLYNMLKKLIDRKYYQDKQLIINLLNNFATFNQIGIEQYSELMILVDDKYTVVEVVENLIEENIENNEIEENV